jgi:phosphoribosyl-AMP cyclohydrolase
MMQSANRRLRKLAFARRRSVEEIEEGEVLALRFDGRELNLVVATDADSGEVLMMGVINAEALVRTIATGEAHYWSRSCKELWRKGATSGLVQRVVEVRIDDDQDAIWLRVEVTGLGGSCHVGYHSCFYRAVPIGALGDGPAPLRFVETQKLFDSRDIYADAPNPTRL